MVRRRNDYAVGIVFLGPEDVAELDQRWQARNRPPVSSPQGNPPEPPVQPEATKT